MNGRNRREFLADVGRGMLVAGLGATTAFDLGLSPAWANEDDTPKRLTFGALEPLVAAMQETPLEKLLPLLVSKLSAGTDIKTLVSAAALANARTFGGQDYTGFHTFMALAPAYQMAQELPDERRALPVLKVLYRNTNRIHEHGGTKSEVLHHVDSAPAIERSPDATPLRDVVRRADWNGAESLFAALVAGSPSEAYQDLQYSVQDQVDVHRVVLAWRAWAMLGLAGEQHAHTLLRQSVRYCLNSEQNQQSRDFPEPAVRRVLPKLLDQYRLLSRPLGNRTAEDAWVEELSRTIFAGSREQAAEAVAAALAEGIDPAAVGEAISLAANQLVLHDPGRRPQDTLPGKPAGGVHGDSVGVHASDAANAWRNIARVSNARNTFASLIVGAFHTAGQSQSVSKEPYPFANLLEGIQDKDADLLLRQAEEAIKAQDQARACALVHRYGELGHAERPLFGLLLRYAISEDGALHGEKYYRTVTEEFATTRPAFRWRQLVALARVTVSGYGFPAPGYAEACQLLGVS
jgi:hypothetical protein